MNFAFQFAFIVLLIYAISVFFKGFYVLKKNELRLFVVSVALHLFMLLYFINDILFFKGGLSYSYGQDSDLYESFILSFSQQESYYYYYNKYSFIFDGKGFYYIAFSSILSAFSLQEEVWLFFVCNLLFFFSSCLIVFNVTKEKYLPLVMLLLFSPISFFLAVTFLREMILIFSIVIVLNYFNGKKVSFLNLFLLLIALFAISQTRVFYLYTILTTLLFWFFLLRHNESINYKLLALKLSVFSFVVIVILSTFFTDFLQSSLIRLLVLNGSDAEHLTGYDALAVDAEYIASGGYSLASFLATVAERAVLGVSKMSLTPLAVDSLYYLLTDTTEMHYVSIVFKLLLFLQSIIFNFFILPLFVSSLVQLRYRRLSLKEFILLSLYFSTLFIYSIKFMGQRNFKIDFILHTIMLAFSFMKSPSYNKPFWYVMIFMMLINVLKWFLIIMGNI